MSENKNILRLREPGINYFLEQHVFGFDKRLQDFSQRLNLKQDLIVRRSCGLIHGNIVKFELEEEGNKSGVGIVTTLDYKVENYDDLSLKFVYQNCFPMKKD